MRNFWQNEKSIMGSNRKIRTRIKDYFEDRWDLFFNVGLIAVVVFTISITIVVIFLSFTCDFSSSESTNYSIYAYNWHMLIQSILPN